MNEKENLDLWVSLVNFVTFAAVLPVIRKANLIPLRLRCAPEKSLFEQKEEENMKTPHRKAPL